MTAIIIIILSILLLVAYLFDLTASLTRIPSVILLLALGFIVKLASTQFNFHVPDLNSILPLLGTIGLILIVLEGALELEINRSKFPLILKTSLVALIPILLISLSIGYYLTYFHEIPFKIALANAIPLAIISSAIAIPSAKNLIKDDQEFITYESSLSDIFGVIIFNFITLNETIGISTFGNFSIELLIMLVISFIATILLAWFLHKINHHIKFVPMIILVLLIYAVAKVFHLPSLIFILIFGLFIGNIDELRRFKFIDQFHPIEFNNEVLKFKEITAELAFLTRALFFILFGFLIELSDILNTDTIIFAILITISIFFIRFLILKLFKIRINPLLYIAPRGLITILLFLSIPITQEIQFINKSLIIQVILLSAFVMMFGLIKYKKPKDLQHESDPII